MGSLTACLAKAGDALSKRDRAAILAIVESMKSNGADEAAAALSAVDSVIAQLQARLPQAAVAATKKAEAAPAGAQAQTEEATNAQEEGQEGLLSPPAGEAAGVDEQTAAPAPKPAREGRRGASGNAKHPKTVMGSDMLAIISQALGGLDPGWKSEFSFRKESRKVGRDKRRVIYWVNPPIPGVGQLFRPGGTQDLESLAELLQGHGFLPPGTVESDPKEAGEMAKSLVRQALEGNPPERYQSKLDAEQANRDAATWDATTEDDAKAASELALADEQRRAEEAAAERAAQEAQDELEIERAAIMDEAGIDSERMESTEDDDIPWDLPSKPQSRVEAMRASGMFTDEEIADAERQEGLQQEGTDRQAAAAEAQPAQEVPGAGSEAPRSERADRQAAEDFGLAAQSESDLKDKTEREARAQELDDKAQIDREAEFFSLQPQTAPDQRKDTTGDLLGPPTARSRTGRYGVDDGGRDNRIVVGLRKELSVLRSLRECLG